MYVYFYKPPYNQRCVFIVLWEGLDNPQEGLICLRLTSFVIFISSKLGKDYIFLQKTIYDGYELHYGLFTKLPACHQCYKMLGEYLKY